MAPSGVRKGLRDPVSILAWTDIKARAFYSDIGTSPRRRSPNMFSSLQLLFFLRVI